MPRMRGGRGRCGVRRFMVPCLLLLLQRGPAHGYVLLSDLSEFGFDPSSLDPSLLYRTLRHMEEDGLVVSEWGEQSLGPQRRDYAITRSGLAHLHNWVEDLRCTRSAIDHLLTVYEHAVATNYLGEETCANSNHSSK
jgi:PadR family transcriptional regulator, regulatory protein PadR